MAETVHLYLKADGRDIKGESTQKSLDREGSIECVYFDSTALVLDEGGPGTARGRRAYEPITIRKRIDKSTPLLAKALTENENVEAEFKFFRPSPKGDGTTQQFYTITIKDARICKFRMVSPDTIDQSTMRLPPLEEVSFAFHTISWTYTDGGVQHEDSWSHNR